MLASVFLSEISQIDDKIDTRRLVHWLLFFHYSLGESSDY